MSRLDSVLLILWLLSLVGGVWIGIRWSETQRRNKALRVARRHHVWFLKHKEEILGK